MMEKAFVVKEKDGKYYYSDSMMVDSPEALKLIDHKIRKEIIALLARKPMYPAEIAKNLSMHEQNVYYHMKQMLDSGMLEVVGKEEIRGTVAKRFAPTSLSFTYSLEQDWKELSLLLQEKDSKALRFLAPFIREGRMNANIVVGSPDPHGPYKARARDGHYAIDLALALGRYCRSEEFITRLDVDTDLSDSRNLIIVGGPVTNLACSKVNEHLPARFSDRKPWGIVTKKAIYTEDSVGLVANVPNPLNPTSRLLVIAGIRFLGTKTAVMALTKDFSLLLSRYSGQNEFYAVVHGFDMDGDGKLDSVELLE